MIIGITERGDAALDQSWRNIKTVGIHPLDGIILITKAPHLLGDVPSNAIVHCTITGYGGTQIEPNVAPPAVTLKAYKALVHLYGSERIVLRIDPIVPWFGDQHKKVAMLCLGRMRISFLDLYPHVLLRFVKAGIPVLQDSFHLPLSERLHIWHELGRPEVCGEPGMDCTGCVSKRDLDVLGILPPMAMTIGHQRPFCKCLALKAELLSKRLPCAHGCLYCYWKG